MPYRSHPKGASTNPNSPRAWATCDRTGFVNNHYKLGWQQEWAGNTLINTGSLVRTGSLDKPQQQFRTLNIPPDPRPIMNARVEQYSIEEDGPASTNMAVSAAAGATTIFVADVTGFTAQKIYVYLDNGGFALVTIQSIDAGANSFVIAPAIPSSSSVNQVVIATGASDVNE